MGELEGSRVLHLVIGGWVVGGVEVDEGNE